MAVLIRLIDLPSIFMPMLLLENDWEPLLRY